MNKQINCLLLSVCLTIILQFQCPMTFGGKSDRLKIGSYSAGNATHKLAEFLGPTIAPGASKEFQALTNNAFKVFYVERNYSKAANLFDGLINVTSRPSDRQLVFGLRNASFYAIGRHEQALDLICKEYSRQHPNYADGIFDIHAHARKIALNSGYEAAIETMLHFRKECHRDEFSPVWVAIPLVKMEYLGAQVHVLDEDYTLPAKDRIVLRQILKKFADDPYADYAHYFLHEFDKIKNADLLSIPRGNLEHATSDESFNSEKLYLQHQIQQAPKHLRQHLSQAISTEECREPAVCDLVAKWFPNSLNARKILVNALRRSWMLTDNDHDRGYANLKAYSDVILNFAKQSTSTSLQHLASEVRNILTVGDRLSRDERQKLLPIYMKGYCKSTSVCLKYLNYFKDSQRSREIALWHMEDLIYKSRLNEFMEFYNQLPQDMQNLLAPISKPLLFDRQKHYVDIRKHLIDQDLEGLLSFAIKIRGRIPENEDPDERPARYPLLAKSIFRFIAQQYPKTSLGERAHYLLYTVANYRVGTGNPQEILEQFISLYPNSRLIDDAYAELGLLSNWRSGDEELAKFYFKKVWKEYPGHNAADNALYHLAHMEKAAGQYARTIYYYSQIVSHYGRNRLGKIASNDLTIMKDAYQAVRDRLMLDGLTFRFYPSGNRVTVFDLSRIRSRETIQKDDSLTSLDGENISSQEKFRQVLSKHPVGAAVPAIFERWVESKTGKFKKKMIKANVTIGQSSIFDVAYVDRDDQLFMRTKPHYKSQQVGAIPSNGKCVRYEGDTHVPSEYSSPWFKVSYTSSGKKKIIGWVNGQYLRESSKCLN